MSQRHPAVENILQFFEYEHLADPGHREVGKLFYSYAHWMADLCPENSELAVGLRKLLEAKDCFLRSKSVKASEDPGEISDSELGP